MTGPAATADDTPRDRPGSGAHPSETALSADEPIRLVRGHASPEELSALIAVFSILASEGDEAGDDADQAGHPSWGGGASSRSRWGSPARLVRTTHPHAPGGWRRSGSPRTDTSGRPAG